MATLSSLIPTQTQTQTQTPFLSVHHNPKSFFLTFRPPTKPFLPRAAVYSPKTTPAIVALSKDPPTTTPKINPLSSGPTRTLTTLFAVAVAVARRLSASAAAPLALAPAAGPLFFAALRDATRGRLNTPLTVVAAGISKWLDIYSGVLLVRVLLSWFPNIPWDRQPLSAIRDLCDPFLNLFRNIIPPVFDTLDVSPLLAFAVLGFLANVLSGIRRVM